MTIQLDMYQTIAVAVVVLMLGNFLKHRIAILERFCIPAPVIGGVIFAIFTCVCYVTGFAEFSFDDILKEVCMVFFFTSVGFQANLKVLKSGGKSLIIFLILFFAATAIFPLTTPSMINDFKACGGFLMLATGFRMVKLKNFPTADMIPAMVLIMPMSWFWVTYVLPLVS